MSENTKIEWCDHSASPWWGCSKVSPGCANCYADTLAHRWGFDVWGKGKPRRLINGFETQVMSWNRKAEKARKRMTVFPSMCDWLDDEVPIEWLAKFLKLIHDTPNLTWLLLTKRPGNWRSRLEAVWEADHHDDWPGEGHEGAHTRWLRLWLHNQSQMQPPSNVWIGTSVEDQPNADRRIPALLRIPAVGRFLSLEPLLGPVDVDRWLRPRWSENLTDRNTRPLESECIDWLIIGGESGHGARPCNVEWIRSLVAQGKDAGVPTFVKQLWACVSGQLDHPANEGYGVNGVRLTHPTPATLHPTPEVKRLKEDVRALKDLLTLCNAQITKLVQWADRAYVDQRPIRELEQLRDRIDAELNG